MISHSARVLARQALAKELSDTEDNICCDKAMVTKYYEHCDVVIAEITAQAFSHLNFWKQELRKDRNKAARIRKALKELK